ncbi:OmpA family protein [candidate division KSB1 bacterium]|nr:OmpA family protein [candidate division KSB1 bacterium]
MSKKTIILIGILAFIALCLICLLCRAKKIEQDLNQKALNALSQKNLPTDVLSFSGRDALLTGKVASEEMKLQIAAILDSIDGIRVVKNQLTVADSIRLRLPDLKFSMKNSVLTLEGMLPDQASVDSLMLLAENVFGKGKVMNKLTVVPAVQRPTWLSTLPDLLNFMMLNLPDGEIAIHQQEITLKGSTKQPALKDELVKLVTTTFGPSYKITNLLTDRTPPPVDTTKIKADFESLLIDATVYFEWDKADLMPDYRQKLNQVANALAKNPFNIEIQGFADASGADGYNLKLSERRARNVQNYLVQKEVKSNLLQIKAFGESQPVGDNSTEAGRQKNRRVELKIKEGM